MQGRRTEILKTNLANLRCRHLNIALENLVGVKTENAQRFGSISCTKREVLLLTDLAENTKCKKQ